MVDIGEQLKIFPFYILKFHYSPIEWAIRNGISRFEEELKANTRWREVLNHFYGSAHWFKDPKFGEAVKHFLTMETAGVENYLTELNDRNPFKTKT